MNYFTANTSELRQGDIVNSHGLRLLIDSEIRTYSYPRWGFGAGYKGRENEQVTVYVTEALVLNRDEVSGEIVPISWTANWDRSQSWEARPHNGEHRWSIQGNDLAYWSVEGASINRVTTQRADGTVYHHLPREVSS